MKKLSVIIPCHNATGTLPRQLDALALEDWPGGWELILADNRSTDGLRELADTYKNAFPELRIISCPDRQTAGYARNAAALEATGESVVFCDADDVAAPGWLRAMGEALEENEFVAGRLNVSQINSERAILSRPEIRQLQSEGIMSTHGFLPWASSANMGIKRKLFLQAGGFNENLPALEDVDLCWRLQRQGIRLEFAREAEMHYRLREGRKALFKQARFYAENFVLLCKLYQPFGFAPPKPSVRSLLRNWYHLARGFPIRFHRGQHEEWFWYLGWRWGCLKGSLKHRYFVP